MKKNKKIAIIAVILFVAVLKIGMNEDLAYAKQLQDKEKCTLIFNALGSGGMTQFTSVEICLNIKEDYTINYKNVKFTKRNVYYYAKKRVSHLGKVGYCVILTRHFKSDGSVLDSFSWINESGLYPDCDYMGCKTSSRTVSYSRNNSYYGQASFIVSVDGASIPQKAKSTKYSLKV